MKRLLILMIEVEQPEGLTGRKLIAETLRHNVLTAYSAQEGLDLLGRIAADAVFVHSGVVDLPLGEVVKRVRTLVPKAVVVTLTPNGTQCDREDHVLDSHRPDHLAELLKKLSAERFGTEIPRG